MYQTHPPLEERLAANASLLAQYPHASDNEDEVLQTQPVLDLATFLKEVNDGKHPWTIQTVADRLDGAGTFPKKLFDDYTKLRIGTPVSDQLKGH